MAGIGGADDERIALIIDTQANLDALRKAIAGADELGGAAQRAGRAGGEAARGLDTVGRSEAGIRKTSRAISELAFAAQESALGGRGAIRAFGELSTTVAEFSGVARMAEFATGIGAVVLVAGTLFDILSKIREESAKVPEVFKEHLGNITELSVARQQMEALRQLRQDALQTFATGRESLIDMVMGGGDNEAKFKRLDDEYAQAFKRVLELQAEALKKGREEQTKDDEDAKRKAEQRAVDQAALAQKLQDKLFDVRRAGMANQEQAAREAIQGEYQARIDEIEKTYDAGRARDEMEFRAREIFERQIDKMNKDAEVRRRKEMLTTLEVASSSLARLSKATQEHGILGSKAFALLGDAIRRFKIGVEAKDSAVMAKKEWAAAMAAFATPGGQASGAMHLVAAAGYAAAAAAGFIEAGGGGGSAGGGGGGGGSVTGSDAGRFTPDAANGGGMAVINLYTMNPYGREATQQVLYNLRRGEVLKDGVIIPPTNGLIVPSRAAA